LSYVRRLLRPRTNWRQNRLRFRRPCGRRGRFCRPFGRFSRLQQNRPSGSRFCRQCVRGLTDLCLRVPLHIWEYERANVQIHSDINIRYSVFSERLLNKWNKMPENVDFGSLSTLSNAR